MDNERLKQILEAALLAAGRPLALGELESLFSDGEAAPGRDAIRGALGELASDWESRSLALQQVASGYRAQVRGEFEPWLSRLWEEKPPRYSRALLETLALIAYRQPITRPEIEEVRGVSVSTQIMRTLQEREWVRVVGHRDAPGKPAMYGTTRQFLDYFGLRSLDQLPPISEIRDLEARYPELELEEATAAADEETTPHLRAVGDESEPAAADVSTGEQAGGEEAAAHRGAHEGQHRAGEDPAREDDADADDHGSGAALEPGAGEDESTDEAAAEPTGRREP